MKPFIISPPHLRRQCLVIRGIIFAITKTYLQTCFHSIYINTPFVTGLSFPDIFMDKYKTESIPILTRLRSSPRLGDLLNTSVSHLEHVLEQDKIANLYDSCGSGSINLDDIKAMIDHVSNLYSTF